MNDEKKKEPQPQVDRFNETARALGCDGDEAEFDEKLKAISRQKPKDAPLSSSKGKRKNAQP